MLQVSSNEQKFDIEMLIIDCLNKQSYAAIGYATNFALSATHISKNHSPWALSLKG